MKRWLQSILFAVSALTLTSCGGNQDDNVKRVAFVGAETDLTVNGLRLSPAAQHVRAATTQGLVGLDAQGEIIPALAERWIVTEDGMSYIFRLRNVVWPDGVRVTGENVRAALNRNMRQLDGTSLGLDLSIIAEIRAMTGRVIEIRLKSPMPQFLQLLSQPELGLIRNGESTGPMRAEIAEGRALLSVVEPNLRGEAETENWQDRFQTVQIQSQSPEDAIAAFYDSEVDAILNGHVLSLPLVDTNPLSRGGVRLDVVYGLFGLKVRSIDGFLAEPVRREALALAIDRESLLEGFGIGAWAPSTRMVPQVLVEDIATAQERWTDIAIGDRKAMANRRVAAWLTNSGGETVSLTIDMPQKVGTDVLFTKLAQDFADIGVTLKKAEAGEKVDLELVDTLARYGDPRWFLNQFHCSLKVGPCVPEADELVASSIEESAPATKAQKLSQAEAAILESNFYIPIGAPIRWSLISGGFDGFAENPWGLHPLFPMAKRPI